MSTPATHFKPVVGRQSAANRLSLDYAAEAAALGAPPAAIIDVHSHIGGAEAAAVYRQVAETFGIGLTYSMTHLEELEAVADVLGDRIRFIAVPNFVDEDRRHHLGRGYIDRITRFHAAGARLVKFWAAPRGTDYAVELGDPSFMRLDAPHHIEAMDRAHELGMYFMTHVGDPDTWFRTKYTDHRLYGTKRQQYEPLERLLERYTQPWIAAHMGGWPEDLEFLSGLLDRHDNLYLDTSATKWMVRELSKHSQAELVTFLRRYTGRVLFGSDIVTSDDHLRTTETTAREWDRVESPGQAFDLYASRYWAQRMLLESGYVGPSPIADPDLSMVDPERYGPMDAPALVGKSLPRDVLISLYHGAAAALLGPLHGETAG